MNILSKNNKQLFFLLLGILLTNSLHAITYNNESLDSIISPGEILVLSWPIKNSVIILDMENGNLNINYGYVSEFFPENALLECFKEKQAKSVRCNKFDTSSNVISHKNSHIITECINFQSKMLLSLKDCFLEAPHILLAGDRMVFEACFLINTQVLYFSTDSPNSNYQTVQILFEDKPEIPTLLGGYIDFFGSPIKKELYLTNVKEIRVEFNPQVWDNSSSENSKPSVESAPSNCSCDSLDLLKNTFKRFFN